MTEIDSIKIGKIHRRIPIPSRGEQYTGPLREAIVEMNCGDFRLIETGNYESCSAVIHGIARRLNIKISTRKLGGNKVGMWRLKKRTK